MNVVIQVPYVELADISQKKRKEIIDHFWWKCETARWIKDLIEETDTPFLSKIVAVCESDPPPEDKDADWAPDHKDRDWLMVEDAGQNLTDYFSSYGQNPPADAEKKRILRDTLLGLKVLHDNGIAYGDLKTDNICRRWIPTTGAPGRGEFRITLCDFDWCSKRRDEVPEWIPRMNEKNLQEIIANNLNLNDLKEAANNLLTTRPVMYSGDLNDIWQFYTMIISEPEFANLCEGFDDEVYGILDAWKTKIKTLGGKLPEFEEGNMIVDEILRLDFFHDLA